MGNVGCVCVCVWGGGGGGVTEEGVKLLRLRTAPQTLRALHFVDERSPAF